MSDPKRTLEQKRASSALKQIQALLKENNYGNYLSYVKALPATIITNGLGQALAMLLAKAGKDKDCDNYYLYHHLASWLTGQIEAFKQANPEKLIDILMQKDQVIYMQAQAEALMYLVWLKQFARAYLKEDKDKGENSNEQ